MLFIHMIFTEINQLANWWKVPTLSPNLKKLYLQTSKGCMNIFPIFLYSFIPPLKKGGTLSIWVCKSAFSFPLAVLSAKAPPLMKCPGGGQAPRTKVVAWLQQNRSLRKVRRFAAWEGQQKLVLQISEVTLMDELQELKSCLTVTQSVLSPSKTQGTGCHLISFISHNIPSASLLWLTGRKKSSFAIQTEFLYQNRN